MFGAEEEQQPVHHKRGGRLAGVHARRDEYNVPASGSARVAIAVCGGQRHQRVVRLAALELGVEP